MSSQEDVVRDRIAKEWDASIKKKAKLYDKGANDHRELKGILYFVGVAGVLIIIASAMFGGNPDLMDGITNYLLTCR